MIKVLSCQVATCKFLKYMKLLILLDFKDKTIYLIKNEGKKCKKEYRFDKIRELAK